MADRPAPRDRRPARYRLPRGRSVVRRRRRARRAVEPRLGSRSLAAGRPRSGVSSQPGRAPIWPEGCSTAAGRSLPRSTRSRSPAARRSVSGSCSCCGCRTRVAHASRSSTAWSSPAPARPLPGPSSWSHISTRSRPRPGRPPRWGRRSSRCCFVALAVCTTAHVFSVTPASVGVFGAGAILLATVPLGPLGSHGLAVRPRRRRRCARAGSPGAGRRGCNPSFDDDAR